MATDAQAPYVTRQSGAMVVVMQENGSLSSMTEDFNYLCHLIV